jgi:MFS family permease
MGISRGGSEPTNVAIVGEWWQKENRGFAVGVHHTGFPIGQFIGPVLMALVLGVATWREVWLVIPLIGIPIIILQAVIGTRKNQHKVYNWIEQEKMTPPLEAVEHEGKFQNPLRVLRTAFTDRNTMLSITMIFLFLWAEQGVATFITLYLTEVVHLPLTEAAIISGASGLTGWIGQIGWGWVSDYLGRKFALRIIIVGWIISVLLMMAITSATSAWLILIFWGLFRNSPYPVSYALLIDSVGSAAGSGMGLMIGIALGVSGVLVPPVAGYFIQTWGWNADYIMLAIATALALIPLILLKETVTPRGRLSAQGTPPA